MIAEYLDGKVTLYSLPQQVDEQGRFRNGDQRGEVAMIIADEKIEHLEYATFAAKDVERGHHYHKQYTEKLYILKGRLVTTLFDIEKEEFISLEIKSGDLITITPNIAHAFIALEQTLVISMGHGARPFEDRFPYKVVKDIPA